MDELKVHWGTINALPYASKIHPAAVRLITFDNLHRTDTPPFVKLTGLGPRGGWGGEVIIPHTHVQEVIDYMQRAIAGPLGRLALDAEPK